MNRWKFRENSGAARANLEAASVASVSHFLSAVLVLRSHASESERHQASFAVRAGAALVRAPDCAG
jgi:hypothetical protein